MVTAHVILQVIAFVFLVLAGLNVASARASFGWIGMALWLLSELIAGGAVLLR